MALTISMETYDQKDVFSNIKRNPLTLQKKTSDFEPTSLCTLLHLCRLDDIDELRLKKDKKHNE